MPQENNTKSQETWPQIIIPDIYSDKMIVGKFGEFPVFNQNCIGEHVFGSETYKIEDFVSGPFIDMKQIRTCDKIRSVDDMLLVNRDDKVTIYDRTYVNGAADKRSLRITNWQDFQANKRTPIYFKPVWDLHASFETINNDDKLAQQALEIFKKAGFTRNPEQRFLGFTPAFDIGRLFFSFGFIFKRRERFYSCILLSVGDKKFVQINYDLPNRIGVSDVEDISVLENYLKNLQEQRKIYSDLYYYNR